VDGPAIEMMGWVRGGLGRERPLPAGRRLRRFAPDGRTLQLASAGSHPADLGIRKLVRLPSKETITAKADLVIGGAESNTSKCTTISRPSISNGAG
jgi:hypothetical protein